MLGQQEPEIARGIPGRGRSAQCNLNLRGIDTPGVSDQPAPDRYLQCRPRILSTACPYAGAGCQRYNKCVSNAVRIVLPALAALGACAIAAAQPQPVTPEHVEFFEKHVRPLLAQHCYQCHSARASTVFAELRLDSGAAVLQGGRSGPAVIPGDPGGSRLIQALRHELGPLAMPPSGKLAEHEIQFLTEWVRLGAPWPGSGNSASSPATDAGPAQAAKHWAWQPLSEPRAPRVTDTAWARGDIDRFVLADLEEHDVEPVGPADRPMLLRRLTLGLTGLPPTPVQIRAFLDDPSAGALESAVDRLLASPAFGERWARHWLDLAGYADTLGLGRRIPSLHAWRYRDYVINAFNRDKPYDRFVREQVAGDVLEYDTDAQREEQIVATGFLAIGPWALVAADKAQLQMDVVDTQLDTLGRAILGLTIGCARCHDHKFDPIPQREYYALAGIFQSTRTLDGRMSGVFSDVNRTPLPEAPRDMLARAEALQRWERDYKSVQDEHRQAERQHEELASELEAVKSNGSDPAARKDLEERVAAARKEAADLRQEVARTWHYAKPLPPMALALADQPIPANARIHLGGSPQSLGHEAPRGFLSLVPLDPHAKIANRRPIGIGVQKSSGRLELAQWLADPGNPLPARVMANRIWHHLFGVGIVASVDNVGLLGERPSHPELLDYLANRLRQLDWSVKGLIREIVLSRAYGLAASHDARAATKDPENRLLWRSNRRRLQAETIRDAVLLVSGSLDRRAGGLSLPVGSRGSLRMAQPPLLVDDLDLDDSIRFRRTVYLPTLRKSQLPDLDVLNLFDFPDPNVVKGKRDVTTVPTQALYLMNSPFLIQQSMLAAQVLLADGEATDEDRVRTFLLRALGRPASNEDLERAAGFLRDTVEELGREAAWARYCHAVFASSEFLFRS